MSDEKNKPGQIPTQSAIPWSVALSVSWAGLRRRVLRALITVLGIVLAIAFLTYLLVVEDITKALVAANQDALNVLLQKNGVDIYAGGKTDSMLLLLIGLSLLTCLVGIVNSMLMSVTERIREIGTMKCLGALDSFIVKSYLIESALQGLAGTVIGILIGMLVSVVINAYSYGWLVFRFFPVSEVLKTAGTALITGAVIAVVAAIAPAMWAARKEPVEAMRTEE